MSDIRSPHLSRRSLLSTGGAVALGALLSACGGGGSGSGSKEAGGGWSYTDDRGKVVSLKSRPTRIVAYVGSAAALHDFGVTDQIVGVYGPTKLKDGRPDPQAGRLDVNRVTIIGNAYGEFNLEKYAALRPELLIDNMMVKPDLFYVPPESKDKILGLAPSIGVSTGAALLTKPIERFAELAVALGADPKLPKVAAAKARFEKASETLRAATKARGGLKVLAGSATPDIFHVSNPRMNSDLMYFRHLGLDMVLPKKPDKLGYFEALSWENADKYRADVIILDSRTQNMTMKDITKPAWKDLPAVRANQVFEWQPEPVFSYEGCAPILERLAEIARTAKILKP